MASLPQQIVLVLDVFGREAEDEIIALLPIHRHAVQFLYLRDNLDPLLAQTMRPGEPLPFASLASAISALVRRARGAASAHHGILEWYVCGQAPLPLFAQLGFEVSAWAAPLVLLNRQKNGKWDRLPLKSDDGTLAANFFQVSGAESQQEATGRVAIFVSVMGNEAPRPAIHEYFRQRGETLAGLVQVRTATSALLTEDNAACAAHQLAETLSSLASAFPNALARGAALFIAGPASLAFIAGRGVNPNIIRETWVPNFVSGEYQDAVALPAPETPSRSVDVSEGAQAERAEVWNAAVDGIQAIQHGLTPQHLSESVSVIPRPESFVRGLQELRLPETPSSESFALRVLERQLTLGESLIDALRSIDRKAVAAVVQHLVVHELIHDFQNLTHANFRNVGRSAVALEEVDFWADACSVMILARMRVDAGFGEPLHKVVPREIDHVLLGIETFDRAEQGDRITRLYERRLRRYLIWYLQRARAATLNSDGAVHEMLKSRVIAELAPLAGHLDARYDKLVTAPITETEFVVASGAHLLRFPPSANLTPSSLVQDVREFRREPLLEFMRRVVSDGASRLAPWATL